MSKTIFVKSTNQVIHYPKKVVAKNMNRVQLLNIVFGEPDISNEILRLADCAYLRDKVVDLFERKKEQFINVKRCRSIWYDSEEGPRERAALDKYRDSILSLWYINCRIVNCNLKLAKKVVTLMMEI